MPSKEHKISKKAAAGTMDITLTNPEKLEIIRISGNATSQSVIMGA